MPDHPTHPDVRLLVAEKVARHLPGLVDATAAHFWAGLRTLTSDDVPIVGDDPDVPGLFWVAGLGGHGMSVSAGLGRVAAAALLGREDPAPGLRPERDALVGLPREGVRGDA